ncbi:hypothetical protein [Profundibacter sp.]|uniref:hypothetical protein n=1 Tax=Profundibacter sp. TaxID=3101071 RepID=UPI003D10D617
MKHLKTCLLGMAIALTGCVENTPPDKASDRFANTVYGASGLDADAYVGSQSGFSDTPNGYRKTNIFYEPKYTTPAKLAAAPAKICAYTNQTVVSSKDSPHPTPQYYPSARVLSVICKG